MAWDVGEPVAVAGEDWKGAWRLAHGVISREGDINQRLDGSSIRVVGRMRRTTTGITGVSVGLETQDAARSATATSLLALTLGAANTWVEFDSYITPPADQVFGRPYIVTTGSGGFADFAAIDLRRGEPPGLETVDTPQMVNGAVIREGGYFSNSTITQVSQSAGSTFGNLVATWTGTIPAGVTEVELDFDFDEKTSGTDPFYYVCYVDATYNAPAGTPANPGLQWVREFNAGSSATIRDARRWKKKMAITPGAHTINVYLRNRSGGTITLYERDMAITALLKSDL